MTPMKNVVFLLYICVNCIQVITQDIQPTVKTTSVQPSNGSEPTTDAASVTTPLILAQPGDKNNSTSEATKFPVTETTNGSESGKNEITKAIRNTEDVEETPTERAVESIKTNANSVNLGEGDEKGVKHGKDEESKGAKKDYDDEVSTDNDENFGEYTNDYVIEYSSGSGENYTEDAEDSGESNATYAEGSGEFVEGDVGYEENEEGISVYDDEDNDEDINEKRAEIELVKELDEVDRRLNKVYKKSDTDGEERSAKETDIIDNYKDVIDEDDDDGNLDRDEYRSEDDDQYEDTHGIRVGAIDSSGENDNVYQPSSSTPTEIEDLDTQDRNVLWDAINFIQEEVETHLLTDKQFNEAIRAIHSGEMQDMYITLLEHPKYKSLEEELSTNGLGSLENINLLNLEGILPKRARIKPSFKSLLNHIFTYFAKENTRSKVTEAFRMTSYYDTLHNRAIKSSLETKVNAVLNLPITDKIIKKLNTYKCNVRKVFILLLDIIGYSQYDIDIEMIAEQSTDDDDNETNTIDDEEETESNEHVEEGDETDDNDQGDVIDSKHVYVGNEESGGIDIDERTGDDGIDPAEPDEMDKTYDEIEIDRNEDINAGNEESGGIDIDERTGDDGIDAAEPDEMDKTYDETEIDKNEDINVGNEESDGIDIDERTGDDGIDAYEPDEMDEGDEIEINRNADINEWGEIDKGDELDGSAENYNAEI